MQNLCTLPVEDLDDGLAEEVPIGFSFGGIAHAVMMATPDDLDDFALGFAVTEGIATAPADIRAIVVDRTKDEIALDITLAPERLRAFLARHRTRTLRGHSSCGVCGVRDLADACPLLPQVATSSRPPCTHVIHRALGDLRAHQPLARRTHAAHAAAWVAPDGEILLAREDIGRHNALDKLIGGVLHAGVDTGAGFCLVTSRCSYEMVQKAVAARFPALVALSAPTTLAVRTAAEAGLILVASAGRV